MARYTIEGCCAPPITPFDGTGKLNVSVIPAYAKWYQQQGIGHVYVAGTSGEGPSLTMSERKQLAEAWLNETTKGVVKTAVIHIGAGNFAVECELAVHAEAHGAHAIACLAPYYYRPSTASELADYLSQVAAAAPNTPFLYYHFPDFTNVRIPFPEIFQALVDKIPTFSGCKYTDWNMQEAAEVQQRYPDTIVMAGRDQTLLQALVLGMKPACVLASGNWNGLTINSLFRAVRDGKIEEARRLQMKIAKPIFSVQQQQPPINLFSAFRAWLEHASNGAVIVGRPRPPLRPLSSAEQLKVVAALQDN